MSNKLKFLSVTFSFYLIATSSALGIANEGKDQKVKIHLEPKIVDVAIRTIQLRKIQEPKHIDADSKHKGLNIGAEGIQYTNKTSPTLSFLQSSDQIHSAASGLLNGYYVFPGQASDINFYAGAGAGLSVYKTFNPDETLESSNISSKKGVDFAYQGFVGMEKRLTKSTGIDVKLKIMNLGNVKKPKTGKSFDGEASIGIKHEF